MTARDRARTSNLARRQDTREALELRRLNQRDPTYGGDGYRVRTLGAAGSIPGRTRSKTSRGSIGEPLDLLSGGLGSRIDAASDQELRDMLRDMQQMIQAISNRRGVLFFKGDGTNPENNPNGVDNDGINRAFQRYDNQLLYTGDRLAPGKLFVHAQATATDPETWLEIETGGGIEINFSEDEPPGGHSVPIDRSNPVINGYSPNDFWHNTVLDRQWVLREIVFGDPSFSSGNPQVQWEPTATKVFTTTPPTSQVDSLVVGDILQVPRYHWFWDGTDWIKGFCCDEGDEPDEPPPDICSGGPVYWWPSCADPEIFNPPNAYTCTCDDPQF
ncbi:hypothetical protein Lepto7375DRAFT_7340 [Leptolyngbya sp. PCC 7375]|nr:hypothetical protein Lepto7375DRAFT_7340 [Leptolyngbya sp. PCC 7375]